MQYYENIVKKRNSCRGFADKKVGDDVLVRIREYYEDDEAFEYMVETLAEQNHLDPVRAVKLASQIGRAHV